MTRRSTAFWLKRRLSAHPRLRSWALALRRRLPWLGRDEDAAAHWDRHVHTAESSEPSGWLDSELIEREYIRPQISGNPDIDYLSHFLRTHLQSSPVQRALSLGCGGGNLERAMIGLDAAEIIDALDISPESIAVATEQAGAEGMSDRISYQVHDIERLELPESSYDFVVAKMALHHLENLEHIFGEIRKALKPSGLLMFNEYVGPSRFQWTDRQIKEANKAFAELPASLRRNAPVVRIYRPTVEDMVAKDPSEAVRSADLLPVLREHFKILELKEYGGGLLHLLLGDIMPLFDPGDSSHRALLRSCFRAERTLTDAGVIDSDFAYVVAR